MFSLQMTQHIMSSFVFIFSLFVISLSLAVFTVFAANPILAAFALIALFVCSAVVILLTGAEFIALIYVLLYVGAVLILFLWVIMTMPVKKSSLTRFRFSFFFLSCSLIFFLFFLNSVPSTIIKFVPISPDSFLFPLFYKQFLAADYEFYLSRFYDRSTPPLVFNFLPAKVVYRFNLVLVPKTSIFYPAFLLHHASAGNILVTYPLTPEIFNALPFISSLNYSFTAKLLSDATGAAIRLKSGVSSILLNLTILAEISRLNFTAVGVDLSVINPSLSLFSFGCSHSPRFLSGIFDFIPGANSIIWVSPLHFEVAKYTLFSFLPLKPNTVFSPTLGSLQGLILPPSFPVADYIWTSNFSVAKSFSNYYHYSISLIGRDTYSLLSQLLFSHKATFFEKFSLILNNHDLIFSAKNLQLDFINHQPSSSFWVSALTSANKAGLSTLADVLYNSHGLALLLVALILLSAMVGAVAIVKFRDIDNHLTQTQSELTASVKFENS